MSRCLVTGAAGFIGSHLCKQLLAKGHSVIGVDAFIPYYPREVKERNLEAFLTSPDFIFYEIDLRYEELNPLLEGIDTVFHLAAMPGLIRSWSDFDLYMTCNLQATYRLLEAARVNQVKHFIYGSTSSVYGRFATGNEELPLVPCSPYGVTKLSAEYLCRAYAENAGLPLTILRFFSVYGPGQRPDMAYHIFIQALLQNEPVTVYGDGEQSRSNTFIDDCVQGILLAFEKREKSVGEVFNIGGGEIVSLNQVLQILAELLARPPRITFAQARPGDQRSTAADIDKVHRILGYTPTTSVTEGLKAQVEWQKARLITHIGTGSTLKCEPETPLRATASLSSGSIGSTLKCEPETPLRATASLSSGSIGSTLKCEPETPLRATASLSSGSIGSTSR